MSNFISGNPASGANTAHKHAYFRNESKFNTYVGTSGEVAFLLCDGNMRGSIHDGRTCGGVAHFPLFNPSTDFTCLYEFIVGNCEVGAAGEHTAPTSIDFQLVAGTTDQYTVVFTYTDENGTTQTLTDPTPVAIPIPAANLIQITDAGGNFTSGNVEGALAELAAAQDVFENSTMLTVSAGTTNDPTNTDLGIEDLTFGGTVHFSSADGSIVWNVTNGSALVDGSINPTVLSGLAHTVITGIDLKPTGNPNELIVEISWTDSDGNPQVTADPTPITVASGGNNLSLGFVNADYDLTSFPPAGPQNAPANPMDTDVYIERYSNGMAYFTYDGTNWNLTTFQSDNDRKFTVRSEEGQDYVNGSLSGPQNPPNNPGQADVHLEVYDNALVYFNYQAFGAGAGWDGNNIVYVDRGVDAGSVTINDIENNFAGTTVEEALAELANKQDTCFVTVTANETINGDTGTLSDGVTNFVRDSQANTPTNVGSAAFEATHPSIIDGLNGDLRVEDSRLVRLVFDNPVMLTVSPITDPALGNPINWTYGIAGNPPPNLNNGPWSMFSSNGTPVAYNAGALTAGFTLNDAALAASTGGGFGNHTSRADANHPNNVPAGRVTATQDWGTLTSIGTEFILRAKDTDAFNISVATVEERAICDILEDLQANSGSGSVTLNDAALGDFLIADPALNLNIDNTGISPASLRNVLRLHEAGTIELGLGGNNAAATNSIIIGNGSTGEDFTAGFSVALGEGAGRNTSGSPYNFLVHGNAGRDAEITNTIAMGLGAGRDAGIKETSAGAGDQVPSEDGNLFGNTAGRNWKGNRLNAFGVRAGQNLSGDSVSAFGLNAMRNAEANNVIALGDNAGQGSTTSNALILGELEFAPYADHAAAYAALPAPSASGTYVYRIENDAKVYWRSDDVADTVSAGSGSVNSSIAAASTIELTDGVAGTNETSKIQTGTVIVNGGVGQVAFTQAFDTAAYRLVFGAQPTGGVINEVIGTRTVSTVDVVGTVDGNYDYIAIGIAP